ncbi:hypothetical protein BU15DRAFT_90386 [Melanogaster broomeanus]|nr:hypothetical protein BU15DRAFT_90386 [Melanogaster broomeanus]
MASQLESDTVAPTLDRLSQTRQFKDAVHDYVSFSPWICSFIDTKHFQRLRYIKQLGLTYYVFPGASHNRFEHCLGVGHLARRMAAHLRNTQPSLGITDQHVECVELAGLCHDLGHGPWSHVWDNIFIPTALPEKKDWTHEQASEMMFDDMVETYQLDITPEEVTIVKALIAGDKERCVLGQTMPFLFEIVANQRNGLDVDKFDYILRDCHAVGDRGNLSLSRLIYSARVIDGMICYDIKDANQIYELYYTPKSIEYMVIDALLEAEPYLNIAHHVAKPKRYIFLTDHLSIRSRSRPRRQELESARAIIIDYKVFSHNDKKMIKENITPEKIVEVAKSGVLKGVDEELVMQLTPKHVAGEKNPLDEVTFYSKKKPDWCGKADYSDISLLMPSSFAEVWLRIYTKDGSFHGLIQAAYRHILKNLTTTEPVEEVKDEGFAPETIAPETQTTSSKFGRPHRQPIHATRILAKPERCIIRGRPCPCNQFTAVPPNFRGESPSRKPRNKRGRDVSDSAEGARPRKSIRLSEQSAAAP